MSTKSIAEILIEQNTNNGNDFIESNYKNDEIYFWMETGKPPCLANFESNSYLKLNNQNSGQSSSSINTAEYIKSSKKITHSIKRKRNWETANKIDDVGNNTSTVVNISHVIAQTSQHQNNLSFQKTNTSTVQYADASKDIKKRKRVFKSKHLSDNESNEVTIKILSKHLIQDPIRQKCLREDTNLISSVVTCDEKNTNEQYIFDKDVDDSCQNTLIENEGLHQISLNKLQRSSNSRKSLKRILYDQKNSIVSVSSLSTDMIGKERNRINGYYEKFLIRNMDNCSTISSKSSEQRFTFYNSKGMVNKNDRHSKTGCNCKKLCSHSNITCQRRKSSSGDSVNSDQLKSEQIKISLFKTDNAKSQLISSTQRNSLHSKLSSSTSNDSRSCYKINRVDISPERDLFRESSNKLSSKRNRFKFHSMSSVGSNEQ